jgi:hypothetical protein
MNDFRRSGQRDDRRRRVLNDELLGRLEPAESPASPDAAPKRPKRNLRYSEAASMDAQPRITDLIPKKIGTFVLLLLAGALAIGALEGLYAWMPRLAGMTTDGRVASFDLDSEGSLGAWFSSLLLAAAGLTALLIWSLRRHRMDDYHGRYRIWLWTAGIWFVMSLDEACSLHEGFKEMMSHTTGQRLFGDGSVWWVGAYLLVLGWLAFRLLMEMRDCRTSLTALVLGGACWGVAVATQLQLLLPERGAVGVMVEEGLEMAGNVLILFSMMFHARHVILDVQGLLSDGTGRPKKTRKRKTAEAQSEPSEGSAVQSAGEKTEKVEKKTAAPVTAASAASASPTSKPAATISRPSTASSARPTASNPSTTTRVDSAQPLDPNRRLSKAERRALKRQEREERE